MDNQLYSINAQFEHELANINTTQTISSLEAGKILYLPNYAFKPHEHENNLLCDAILHPKHKNISYRYGDQQVSGTKTSDEQNTITPFMHRYSDFSKQLIDALLPHYSKALRKGRTSYRPAEIKGRTSSKRKDDTRVHVDAFPATPVNGLRILRVFSNINPYNEPRVWNIGEPFPAVLSRFGSQLPRYSPFKAHLLQLIKATKTRRSPYDHYMLALHDTMKLDDAYQANLKKHQIDFPAQSTWIVFTDQVSHAALSGQFLLEQTFYLPVTAMYDPRLSPLKQLEKQKSF
jgi:hypothetical protein